MRKYIIRKSREPNIEGDHIVVLKSYTQYGINEQRVFKGTLKECLEKKIKLEESKKNERSKNSKSRRKTAIKRRIKSRSSRDSNDRK